MGIQGLLPLLKSISDPVHVSSYAGQRVGVDAYAWLHRGAHTCATQLALGQPTDGHLQFCMTRVKLLLSLRVSVVMVFDGGRLPSKRGTEEERSVRRKKERSIGMQLTQQGQHTAAMKAFQKCISITSRMTHQLITLCNQLNASQPPNSATVECIVAPYEADAQLAYLSHSSYVVAAISEDSDLLVFGCRRVLYKMDGSGHGTEIKLRNLAANTDPSFHGWTHSQFQQMAVLAGCDYLPSLPQLGIKKAHTLIKTAKDWHRAIKKVRLEGRVRVYEEYERDFECALLCFQHQRVWDPVNRCVRHLTELSAEVTERYADLSFLGPEVEPEIAQRIAAGEVHPTTLEPFTDEDMEGIGQREAPKSALVQEGSMAGLRRAQSASEVVTADVDVGDVERVTSAGDGAWRTKRSVHKSGVSNISQLLVQNKISGYCVRVSQATRSGFVPPRSTHKQEGRADDGPATTALTRSVSLQPTPQTASRSKGKLKGNPFAAYAYGSSKAGRVNERADEQQAEEADEEEMQRKEEFDGDDEDREGDVRRLQRFAPTQDSEAEEEIEAEDTEADQRQTEREEQRRRASRTSFYGDEAVEGVDNNAHSRPPMHAYSLPQRSYHQQRPLEDEPPPVPPDDLLDALAWPDMPITTFAATPPLSQSSQHRLSPSPSPSPSPSSSPSPSPSPPPVPASGAVFSSYFPPPSSSTPSPHATSRSERFGRHRDEIVIDDDDEYDEAAGEDVDDDGCVMLDDDKENVDTANLRPLSQLDGDLDDIEDDESPSSQTSYNPAPSPPPLRFGNKRQTQSTGDALHTPHKTTSKPLLPQSAPPQRMPSAIFAPYRQQQPTTPHSAASSPLSARVALPPAPRVYNVARVSRQVSAVMNAHTNTTTAAAAASSSVTLNVNNTNTSKRSSSLHLSQPNTHHTTQATSITTHSRRWRPGSVI